jgi:hypothetical protein
LILAGLRIETLHEYPYAYAAKLPLVMARNEAHEWRVRAPSASIPLLYAIKATKAMQG